MSVDRVGATSAIAASNLWILSRLREVLTRSDEAEIGVIVLKGAAFLGWIYRLDERTMADVDLLIHPNDRGRFIDALAPEARLAPTAAAQGLLHGYGAGQFSVDFRGLPLDVHTHLLDSPWLRHLVPFDEHGLWARASTVTIAGQRAQRLSVEDQLLHLAAHATLHHPDWTSDQPHRINDAVRILQATTVDWDLLTRLARSQGIRTAAWLLLSNAEVSRLVPPEVLTGLRPGRVARARIRLAARVARDRPLAAILLTDRSLGVLRALAVVLTPSSDWLRRSYANTPTAPGRVARHYVRVGTYAIDRLRRAASPVSSSALGTVPLGVTAKVGLALRIWFWFLIVHLELRRRPLPQVVSRLRMTHEARTAMAPRRLGQIVLRTLRVGRHQPRCLIAALVLYRMLAEQGDRGELVIGLREGASNENAHAWIEIGGADVGPPPGRSDHLALARYR